MELPVRDYIRDTGNSVFVVVIYQGLVSILPGQQLLQLKL